MTWDINAIESRLASICNLNSGTANQSGVRAVQDRVVPWFDAIADEVELVSLPAAISIDDAGQTRVTPMTDAVVIRRRTQAKLQVLLGIHLDTVYGPDSPFQCVSRLEANVLRGPGVADAKGGLMVMLSALQAFESRVADGDDRAAQVGWSVFLNPDEEIGSPSSAGVLCELAGKADFGMVYEPTLPDGTLIRSRKGSGNFTVVVRGRSAHAGREIEKGRNAVSALCRLFGQIERLHQTDGSVTVNLGRIVGGGPVNVVPDLAIGSWNVRVADAVKSIRIEQEMRRCVEEANAQDGITVQLEGGMTSQPKPFDEAAAQLFGRIIEVGTELGLNIETAESGGVCDGNKLAAAGCPTVDTLGPRGGNIHSDQEYVLIDSLKERAKLSEAILLDFARHPDRYPTRKSNENR